MRKPVLVAVALAAARLCVSTANADGILQQESMIPATFSGFFGKKTVKLETLVLRPDDGEKHPLVIINHHAPDWDSARPHMRPTDSQLTIPAVQFARRGWVTVILLRRGFGRSEDGTNAGVVYDSIGHCGNNDYVKSASAGAEDIAAGIDYFAKQPYVDATRIVSVGHSDGGLATLALTAGQVPGLFSAIVFTPGAGHFGNSYAVCSEDRLVGAARTFGKTSRVPVLWVTAENDRDFPPELAKRMVAAFHDGGGNVTFVLAPPTRMDGFKLFTSSQSMKEWTPIVDSFLKSQGMNPRAPLLDDSSLTNLVH